MELTYVGTQPTRQRLAGSKLQYVEIQIGLEFQSGKFKVEKVQPRGEWLVFSGSFSPHVSRTSFSIAQEHD